MNTTIETTDIVGERHIATTLETPLRDNAFDMDDNFLKLNRSETLQRNNVIVSWPLSHLPVLKSI